MRHLVAPLDHVLRLLVILSLLFSTWPAEPVVAGPPAAPPGQAPEPTPAPLGTVTPVSGRPALPSPTATAVPRRPLSFEPGYELFLPLILKQGEAGTGSTAPAMSDDWLSRVKTDIRHAEYQVTWQEGTSLADLDAAYQAPNRAHNLRTYFTPGGIRVIRRTETVPSWEWGLRLSRYGYEGAMQPAAEAQLVANGNGIEYRRQAAPGGLTEWYLNEVRGLKQGFTFQTPPPAGARGPLRLTFNLSGNLRPSLNAAGTAIEFTTPEGRPVLRYSELAAYDARGQVLPAWLALEGDQLSLLIDDAAARYPLTIDPLLTSPAWTAEGNQEGALLGYAVGTAGDVNNDGYADVIVGAYGYDNGEMNEGRAYVYHGSASGLSTSPDWTAESNQAAANFGIAVGTAGDVNNDGYADVIVGASGYDNGQTDEGRAYVYYGSASGLSTSPDWTAEPNAGLANFGSAVGTAGDIDNDGYADVIVGARNYFTGFNLFEGGAFVYHGSASGLSTTAAWTAKGNQSNAYYGSAVGTAGDVDNDGYADVIVGASGYSNGQSGEGRAFVYHGSASGLNTTPAWTAEGDQASANFGDAAGTAGDVNGDGYDDVIVGAYGYDNGQTDEGRAFVYYGSAGGLSTSADWTAESDQAGASFGISADTAGDVNGDGYDDVIVGAYLYDNGENNEGAAFAYYGSASGLSTSADWAVESNQASTSFGSAVGTAGDVDNDGYAEVIVGAYFYDNGETDEGQAYVYAGSGSADEPITGLSASNDSPTGLGQATTLTATITAGNNVSYAWAFGDGTGGSGAVVTHTYLAVGNYTALVTATNALSVVTATTAVTITGVPALALAKSGPANAQSGALITYTLTVTNSGSLTATNLVITDTLPAGATYVSGGTPVGGVVSWTVASLAAGSDTGVELVVTATQTISNSDYRVSAGGGISATGQVTVVTQIGSPPPLADFSATPLSGTVPLTVTFSNASSNAGSYQWAFGDGATSTEISPTHTYTQSGVYTVSLTAMGPGGSDTLTRTNYISAYEPVVADFSATPLTGTVPLTVTFSNSSSGADTYSWAFGDGSTSPEVSPSHTYTQSGVYTVSLTATGPGGSDFLTRTNYITVTEAPTQPPLADFSATPLSGTIPLTVTFSNASSNASSYQWTFGDGVILTEISPTHTYTQSGVYTVSLTASGPGGSDTLTRTNYITAYEAVVADFNATPLTGTVPLTVTFSNASSGADTYSWAFGDGVTTAEISPTHAYTQSGVYTVSLVATGPGGSETLTRTNYITAYESVVADFSAAPVTGTAPLTVTFSNSSSGADSYSWTFGDGGISTVISPTHIYTQGGVYTVSLTAIGSYSSHILTRTNYITVYQQANRFTVKATSPMSNGLIVPGNSVISASFNYPVNGSTVNSRTFTLYGQQTGVYTGNYTVLDDLVTFDADTNFKPGEVVVANLSNELAATNGITLTPYVWQFQVAVAGGRGVFTTSGQLLGNSRSYAAALGDLDGDGDLDAFVGNEGANKVWLNGGLGYFSDSGQSLGSLRSVAAALGDLDGDGDLDAFVGNQGGLQGPEPDKVWLNNGWGIFSDSGQSLGNSRAYAVALGDLDGDGDLDAFVGTNSGNQIWLNDGTSNFSDSGQSLGTSGVKAVALGDLDGDGDLDAFVGTGSGNQVWLNDGGAQGGTPGNFSDSGQSLGTSGVKAVALGDLDGDGDLDAFVGTGSGNQVWLNDGGAQGGTPGNFSNSGQNLGSSYTVAMALGDVDGDGDLDAFAGNEGANIVWLNDGTGTFSAGSQSLGNSASNAVVLGDLDGDGDLDAFVGNEILNGGPAANRVWLNQLPFTALATNPAGNGLVVSPDSPISATFDQAYDPQTIDGNTISVWGKESGPYIWFYDRRITDTLTLKTFADFRPGEEVVVSLNRGLKTLEGDQLAPREWQFQTAVSGGTGLFAHNGQSLGSVDSYAVALGDVDRDGDLDAFVGNSERPVGEGGVYGPPDNKVWLNDGAGTFSDSGQSLGSADSRAVALGDLDGDGDLDAFVGNIGANAVWLNNDLEGFGDSGQSLGSSASYAMALGDLDGDGDLDAFVGNNGANTVWLNDGAGNFFSGQSVGSAASYAVALGDLDGDGDLDAFVANDGANRVWLNDGIGNFISSSQSLGSADSRAVALGDLDGDGDLDAFVANIYASNKVWLNDGAGNFNSGQSLGEIFSYAVALGDLDGDGDLDAYVANEDPNKVWLNDGEGNFSAGGQNLGNAYSHAVALGDLDGDGDLDAFVGNIEFSYDDSANKVWLNRFLGLGLTKSGPAMGITGELITYTLTVTSSEYLTATNLVITDAIPAGANYVSGGTKTGNIVEWTVPQLAAGGAVSVSLVITVATIGSAVTPTLTITNDTYGVAADEGFSAIGEAAVATIFRDPAPKADFVAGNLQGSTPLTVTFTNLSTPTQHISVYIWDYGDGVTSTTPALTHAHTYTRAGVYTVTLTATGPGGTDVLTRSAYVKAPGADFTITPQLGPAPLEVTFSDILTDRVTGRTWDFGDGITQTATTQISATHIYTQPGVYTPALTVVREGYSYTETKPARLIVSGAEFEAVPRTGLGPLTVTFSDYFSGQVTYRAWDFGDGTEPFTTSGAIETATSLTTTHTYTQAGTYTVTLTVTRGGYTYTQTAPNMILVHQAACSVAAPQIPWWDSNFFYRQPITLTVNQPLTYTAGVSQVLALTLDTQTLITNGLVLPGGADLRVVYRAGTAWRDLPRHMAGLNTPTTTVYFPLQATISDLEPETNYYLYYGNNAPGLPPALYQEIQGVAVLTATGTGAFTPTVNFTATPYAGLAPLQVSFSNLTTPTTGIDSYSWTFGDGGASSDPTPTYTYTTQGLYTVTLTAVTTEGVVVTNTWPTAIQVWGVDVSSEATATLGGQQTPVVTATICTGQAAPQTFTSADGAVQITFPPGSIQETMVITHTPQQTGHLGEGILGLFEMTATTLTGSPVTTFTDGVVVTLQYDDTGLADWQEATIFGFVWDEDLSQWEYLPTSVDRQNNIVYFSTDHFSPLGAGVLGQAAQLPVSAVSAAQPDLFSGAATWSYPLRVPPGRKGLQPNLTLSYNSSLADLSQTTFQKSGWVGLGFNLDAGYIEIHKLNTGAWVLSGSSTRYLPTTDIEAYLILNGGRTRLVRVSGWFPDPTNNPDLVASFRLEQEGFMQVSLMQNSEADGFAATSLEVFDEGSGQSYILPKLYWLVRGKDGATYRFGYHSDSVKVDLAPDFLMQRLSPGLDVLTDLAWLSYPGRAYLDEVRDSYGNQMTLSYDKEIQWTKFKVPVLNDGQVGAEAPYNLYARLKQIDYTGSAAESGTRRVAFEYNRDRFDQLSDYDLTLKYSVRFYPKLLSAVQMSVNEKDTLRYEFFYEELGKKNVSHLMTVAVKGQNETLPNITFDYNTDNGRLTKIDNGYGGLTTFAYYGPLGFNSDPKIGYTDWLKRQEFATSDQSTPAIVQYFSYRRPVPSEREVIVKDGGANRITHYTFHEDVDLLRAKTGHLKRVEVRYDGILLNKLVQSTCYFYDDDYIAAQAAVGDNVFVAPLKITTAFDGICGPSGDLATEYQYDQYGNVTEITELGGPGTADDRRTTMTYIYNPTAWVVNRPDVQTIYGKNDQGAWTQAAQTDYDYTYQNVQAALATQTTTQVDHVNGVNLATIAHYDGRGNVTQIEDGAGQLTTITYDQDGVFPTAVTYPGDGLQTQTSYDSRWGLIKKESGFNGETTTYLYDDLGRLDQVTDPAGSVTDYAYIFLADGLEVRTVYAVGQAESYLIKEKYNGQGQLVQSQSQSESTDVFVSYEYDALGRLRRTSVPYRSAPGGWTTTDYDPINRPAEVTNPDGTRRTMEYQSWQQTTIIDEESNKTTYTYDGLGRTIGVKDGENQVTDYAYDVLNNLTGIEDPASNVTTIAYDGLGRQITLDDPDMGMWSYQYDSKGNLIRQPDAGGQTICFYYDTINRLAGKIYLESASCPPDGGYNSYEIKYYYDQGQRSRMEDESGSTEWSYDAAGQIREERKIIFGTLYTTGFSYDALGRVKTITYPDGEVVTYEYDQSGLDKVTTTESEGVYLDSITHNALGQPETTTLGSGGGGANPLTINYDYHPGNFRLSQATVQNSIGSTLQDVFYLYDQVGNLETLNGSIGQPGSNIDLGYGYDALYRLTSVGGVIAGEPYSPGNYVYDNLSNLTTKDGQTLTYDPQKPHTVAAYKDATYTYDANGNREARLSSNGDVAYTYNAENQLTHIVSDTITGPITTTFAYDGDGNRVQRWTSAGELTQYVGDYYEVRFAGDRLDKSWTFDTGSTQEWYGYNWALADGDPAAFVGWTDAEGNPAPGALQVHYGGQSGVTAYYANFISDPLCGLDEVTEECYYVTPETTLSFCYKITKNPGDSVRLRLSLALFNSWELLYSAREFTSTDWLTVTQSLSPYTGLGVDGLHFSFAENGLDAPFGSDTYLDTISLTGLQERAFTTTLKHYYAGGGRIATRVDDGLENKLYYVLADPNGQYTLFTDAGGEAVGYTLFNPLGEVITSTLPATLTDKLLPHLDAASGLQYDGRRYYDPEVGSYLQPNSIGAVTGVPQSLNYYAPLNHVNNQVPIFALAGGLTYQRTIAYLLKLGYLAGTNWWTQQLVNQGITYGTNTLASYSLLRFSVSASRHKLLTRLPQEAVDILGGRGAIERLPANRTLQTLSTDGIRLVRGQALSHSAFDDFLEVLPHDGRSTRWAGRLGDDFLSHNLAWLGSRWYGITVAGVGDAAFQLFWPGTGDVWNYQAYGLTPGQLAGRTLVAAGGGVLAWGVIEVATLAVGAFVGAPVEVPFLVGAAAFVGSEYIYTKIAKRWLYEQFDLCGENEPQC